MTKYSLIENFDAAIKCFVNKVLEESNLKSFISNSILELCSIYLLLLSYFCNDIYLILNSLLKGLFWLVLGILSSIGFGTGLQTGLLFVMPKVLEVTKLVSSDYNNQADVDYSDYSNLTYSNLTYSNLTYSNLTYSNNSCSATNNVSNFNNSKIQSVDIQTLFYYSYECFWFVFI